MQYFDEAKISTFGNKDVFGDEITTVKGYGIALSADIPLWGGNAMVGAGYLDAESTNLDQTLDVSRWGVHAGYKYALSKRTNLYGVLGYEQDKVETKAGNENKPEAYKVTLGLRHQF